MQQLSFGDEPIKTIVIEPAKDMPFEIFKLCHRLSHYMEVMERIDDNHVIWREDAVTIYCEQDAEAEYFALQNDWFVVTMELPKKFLDTLTATD